MKITVKNGAMSADEQKIYSNYIREKYPDKNITELTIVIDGNYIDLYYSFEPVPFERIRRITGYLVGTLGRWNNGKKSEEADRVKHGVQSE